MRIFRIIISSIAMMTVVVSSAQEFILLKGQFGAGRTIEWETSGYGSGYGHKIHNSDPGGHTLLNFAVRNNSATWTDAMSITSTGNIGIGTKTLASRFAIHEAGAVSNYMRVTNGTSGEGSGNGTLFGINSSMGATIWNYENTELYFGTNNLRRMTIDGAGYVGIGTTTPLDQASLTIKGGGASWKMLALDGNTDDWFLGSYGGGGFFIAKDNFGSTSSKFVIKNDYVGIGTVSPGYNLEVSGSSPILAIDASQAGGDSELFFDTRKDNGTNHNTARIVADAATGGTTSSLSFYIIDGDEGGWDQTMTIKPSGGADPSGNVGIGTTSPTEKLEVNGTVRSKEVKVEASPWPDYVFESNYDLPALEEIEKFIQSNGHLPEVPSAEEVKVDGIALGEMNALLLKKIEELTLYQIEMMKMIKAQQEEITKLKNQ